jgi:uncharacterized membrane protein YfcA
MPISELLGLAGALLAAGLATGLLAGLLGIGGGGILVPVLYEVFGALGVDDAIRMHLAVGTSLAVIVPTSLRSFAAHRARGAVDLDLVRAWRRGWFSASASEPCWRAIPTRRC